MSEEKENQSDFREAFGMFFKLHPFVLLFCMVSATINGYVLRSELQLLDKAVIFGSVLFLQLLALGFEAIRINRIEQLREDAMRKGVFV